MKGAGGKPGERVFLALEPPVEVRAEAEAWARHIARSSSGLRVVPARNSHITLAFLGQRDGQEIEQIARAAERAVNSEEGPDSEVAHPGSIAAAGGSIAGGLSLGAPAWLPKRRPRSLVLDIHDDLDELAGLQARLARLLGERIGWQEGRPYRPHLTCGRTGRGFDSAGLRLPVSPAIAFAGESVTLYRSLLSPEGAEYEAIERLTLTQ